MLNALIKLKNWLSNIFHFIIITILTFYILLPEINFINFIKNSSSQIFAIVLFIIIIKYKIEEYVLEEKFKYLDIDFIGSNDTKERIIFILYSLNKIVVLISLIILIRFSLFDFKINSSFEEIQFMICIFILFVFSLLFGINDFIFLPSLLNNTFLDDKKINEYKNEINLLKNTLKNWKWISFFTILAFIIIGLTQYQIKDVNKIRYYISIIFIIQTVIDLYINKKFYAINKIGI